MLDLANAQVLSYRAAAGFLSRLDESGILGNADFYAALEQHVRDTRPRLTPQLMTDRPWDSTPETRRRMARQARRDTKPELLLRRELFARGLRYRVDHRPESDLRWRLDIVFVGAKVAVDVRGCYWHACPQHGTLPKSNEHRWAAKFARNVERDAQVVDALEEKGWAVLVVWEHDVKTAVDLAATADDIASLVRRRSPRDP